jgi:hypothetical protein
MPEALACSAVCAVVILAQHAAIEKTIHFIASDDFVGGADVVGVPIAEPEIELILAGTDYSAPGQPTIRGIWKLEDGDVRETATTSSDGGATWEASIRFDFPTAQSPNQR